MIHDLDRSLEELLKRAMPIEISNQVTISFATPDDQFPPQSVTLPAIDLFLYDVRENRELRTNEWIIERRSDGTTTRQRPPARIDCSYLITAWPSDNAPNPALDEHRLLSEVMLVLLRYSILPEAVLFGTLAGQDLPLPTSVLLPGRLQSLGEFWQALGGKPKAALNYTVTICVTAHSPEDLGLPVVDQRSHISGDAPDEDL
jgi:hypothetical protein